MTIEHPNTNPQQYVEANPIYIPLLVVLINEVRELPGHLGAKVLSAVLPRVIKFDKMPFINAGQGWS